MMFSVRIHGRGGQGVVTAAELLALAGFTEGRAAQAFPSFGSERTGAPVVSYCRLSSDTIRTREPVVAPDAVLVQDATLVGHVDLFAGLVEDGYVLVNTSRSIDELGLTAALSHLRPDRVLICPASEIALEFLGRPLPNAALLGGFAALTSQVTLAALSDAIRARFTGPAGEANVAAATEAYQRVLEEVNCATVA